MRMKPTRLDIVLRSITSVNSQHNEIIIIIIIHTIPLLQVGRARVRTRGNGHRNQRTKSRKVNRTLVKPTRTMSANAKLSEPSWEAAIAHAAYGCSRANINKVANAAPYECLTGKRLNVAHLHDFGLPVWTLNQG